MPELALAVIIVIVTSALCSLFEAALYALPASHIESLVQAGRPSGRILQKLREHVDKPITAILSLNTISNTAGAVIAGALAARVMGGENVIYFSAAFTLAILFFSEVFPKTVGVVYNRRLAVFIAWPLQLMVWFFLPLIWLTRFGTRLISGRHTETGVSPDELVVMTRMGLKTGAIREDEAAVIQNILAVRSKTVQDVMTPRSVVFSLNGDLTVAEASQNEHIYSHSRVPIFLEDSEDVAGVLYRRDLLSALAENRSDVQLKTLMKPVHFVLETSTLNKVLANFLERGQHMFVVIDEFGGLSGVITLEDVLEEILGKEIVDEFDQVADMRALAIKRREELLRSNMPPPKRRQP